MWLVSAKSAKQFDLLSQWAKTDQVDFWEAPSPEQSVRVMVEPIMQSKWLKFLLENHIQHDLIIHDVER